MPLILSANKSAVRNMSLLILKRNHIIVKFKTMLYNTIYDNSMEYYYKEYKYNKAGQLNMSLELNPNSYIEINLYDDEGDKISIYMTEVHRNKFIRKISKLMGLLEAYDMDDIDILKVDANGTRINPCFANESSASFNIAKKKFNIELTMKELTNEVAVLFTIDDVSTILSIYDFITMMYRIKSIDYISLEMDLINYLGMPELGKHSTDYRQTKINPNAEDEIDSKNMTSTTRLSW